MSLTSQVDKSAVVVITGLPQVIPTTFPFQSSADLLVLNLGSTGTPNDPAETLTLGSDYTVTGGGYNSANEMQTGSITAVSTGTHSLAVGDRLMIKRAVAINQTSDFDTTGPLTIQILEQALDKMATLAQQVNEICGRSLQFENFETLDPVLSLADRKGMVLGFDATTGGVSYVASSSLGTSFVTQIIAGTNISLSPVGGTGVVTINSTGGSVGTGTSGALGYYAANGTALSPTNAATFGATFGSGELLVYSNDSTSTRLTLSNTSSGGVSWYLGSGGSGASTAGAFGIADFTSPGSPPYLSIAKTTGKTTFVTPTTSTASINLPHGAAPSSPVNGDVWTTTTGMFARINSSTVGPFSTGGGGSGTVNSGTQFNVAYYAANGTAVSGSAAILINATDIVLTPPTNRVNIVAAVAGTNTLSLDNSVGDTVISFTQTSAKGLIGSVRTAGNVVGDSVAGDFAIANVAAGGFRVSTVSGNATSQFALAPSNGALTHTPGVRNAVTTPYFNVNMPADTAITASTEAFGFRITGTTRQWAAGTVTQQREVLFPGPIYSGSAATATFTDAFTLGLTPPTAGTNAAITRAHSLGILDSNSASSSITGGLIVATAFGTAATSVGIGGGNINAGGLITGGTITSTGLFTASSTSTFTGAATFNNAATFNGTNATTALTVTQTARTSGILPYVKWNLPADTGLTASTEAPGFQTVTATRTWATTGTVATQREFLFVAPTYASASASQTFTDSATLAITGAPISGTNAIQTNPKAFWVQSGASQFGGVTGFNTYPSLTTVAGVVPAVQVAATSSFVGQGLWQFSNDTTGASFYLTKSRSGTVGTNAAVQSGDNLATLNFIGGDGTNFLRGAQISATATSVFSAGAGTVDLVFSTSTANSYVEMARFVSTTRFQIASGKVFRLGSTRAVGAAAQAGTITIEDAAGTTVTLLTA